MPRKDATAESPDVARRRRAAVRTAWIMAAIAIAVYVAFLFVGTKPT